MNEQIQKENKKKAKRRHVKKYVEREGEKVIWMREVEWREMAKRDERKIMEMRKQIRMETLRKREEQRERK